MFFIYLFDLLDQNESHEKKTSQVYLYQGSKELQ